MDVQIVRAWIRNMKPGETLSLHASTEIEFREIENIFYQVSAEFSEKGWRLSLSQSNSTVICTCH